MSIFISGSKRLTRSWVDLTAQAFAAPLHYATHWWVVVHPRTPSKDLMLINRNKELSTTQKL